MRVLAAGTAMWALALCALLPFTERLDAAGYDHWVWTCLTGTFLGLCGIAYCRRRRDAMRRGSGHTP